MKQEPKWLSDLFQSPFSDEETLVINGHWCTPDALGPLVDLGNVLPVSPKDTYNARIKRGKEFVPKRIIGFSTGAGVAMGIAAQMQVEQLDLIAPIVPGFSLRGLVNLNMMYPWYAYWIGCGLPFTIQDAEAKRYFDLSPAQCRRFLQKDSGAMIRELALRQLSGLTGKFTPKPCAMSIVGFEDDKMATPEIVISVGSALGVEPVWQPKAGHLFLAPTEREHVKAPWPAYA